MDLIKFIGSSPYSPEHSKSKTRRYYTGGEVTSPTLVSKKPLSRSQMAQLSNNWENGPQGYQLDGNYYDRTGAPVSKEHYDYYYESNGKPIEYTNSSITGETNSNIYNSSAQGSVVDTNSDFTSVHNTSNGGSRTIRNIIRNTQGKNPQSYTISYDVNNPDKFFNAQGISTDDAKRLVFK
jgi:hypothetical protein